MMMKKMLGALAVMASIPLGCQVQQTCSQASPISTGQVPIQIIQQIEQSERLSDLLSIRSKADGFDLFYSFKHRDELCQMNNVYYYSQDQVLEKYPQLAVGIDLYELAVKMDRSRLVDRAKNISLSYKVETVSELEQAFDVEALDTVVGAEFDPEELSHAVYNNFRDLNMVTYAVRQTSHDISMHGVIIDNESLNRTSYGLAIPNGTSIDKAFVDEIVQTIWDGFYILEHHFFE